VFLKKEKKMDSLEAAAKEIHEFAKKKLSCFGDPYSEGTMPSKASDIWINGFGGETGDEFEKIFYAETGFLPDDVNANPFYFKGNNDVLDRLRLIVRAIEVAKTSDDEEVLGNAHVFGTEGFRLYELPVTEEFKEAAHEIAKTYKYNRKKGRDLRKKHKKTECDCVWKRMEKILIKIACKNVGFSS
jgi:hypothetical protein